MLGNTIALISSDTNDDQIFRHLPTKRSVLQEQIDSLKKHKHTLAAYREESLSHYFASDGVSRHAIHPKLFDTQTDAIADLVGLAKSLKIFAELQCHINCTLS